MASRYECIHKVTARCVNGTRKAVKCPTCGGQVIEYTGDYGVFVWRADGRYRLEDAKRVFQTPVAAQRFADAGEADGLVVRFIMRYAAAV